MPLASAIGTSARRTPPMEGSGTPRAFARTSAGRSIELTPSPSQFVMSPRLRGVESTVDPVRAYVSIGKNIQGHRSLPSFKHADDDQPESPSVSPVRDQNDYFTDHDLSAIIDEVIAPLTPQQEQLPFHERIARKAQNTSLKKEAMRERAILAEMNQLRDKPKISKHAESQEMTVPFHVRTAMRAEQRKKDLEEAQRARQMERDLEVEKYSFKPKITKRGKLSPGTTKRAEQKQTKQLLSTSQQQMIDDLSECVFTPEINKRSSKLAQNRKVPVVDPNYTHADSLMDRSQQSRVKNFLRNQKEYDDMNPHTPAISKFAAGLELRDNVIDHLYTPNGYAEQLINAKITPTRVGWLSP